MAAPIVEAFISSREKPKNAYGQNGYPGQSSLTPGQPQPSLGADVAPKQTAVPGMDHQDTLAHRVKMDGDKAAEITPHVGMSHRSPSDGSPGGHMNSADSLRRNSGKTLNARTGGR